MTIDDFTKSRVAEHIADNRFIVPSAVEDLKLPFQTEFYSTDNKKLFKHNIQRQPQGWRYRSHPVIYRFNSNGYRAPEFDTVDWANSVVIFGCSFVLGDGLDESETLSSQLSSKIGIPVINMGMSGSCIYTNHMNLLALLSRYPKPKAVINAWTSYHRLPFFESNKALIVCESTSKLGREWNKTDSHSQVMSLSIVRSIDLLLKAKNIPHFQGSFFEISAKLFNCKLLESVDLARDMMHYGVQSHQLAAEYFAHEYSKLFR